MARNLTAAAIAAMIDRVVRPRLIAYFDFPAAAARVWSGLGDLSWDGQTWTGVGTLGSLQPSEGGIDISAKGVVFALSGIPSSLISAGLAADYQLRSCKWWLAFMDANDSVIATPYRWSGRMDTLDIDDAGETSSITIRAESRLIDLEKPRDRRYTDQDQQQEYPGDLGLEFSASILDLPIHWGGKNQERTIPRPLPKPKVSA